MAGQRVQIIKRSESGGRLQLGTEVVAAADGSLAALLGASPGASTAVTIMLEVLERCFPQRLASEHWQQRLQALLPSYGEDPIADGDERNEKKGCLSVSGAQAKSAFCTPAPAPACSRQTLPAHRSRSGSPSSRTARRRRRSSTSP